MRSGSGFASSPPPREIARDHLVDRREVVLLPQALDLELAVLGLLRAGRPRTRPASPTVSVPWLVRDVDAHEAPRHHGSGRGRGPARRPGPRRAPRSRTTRSGGSRAGAAHSGRPARASAPRSRAAGRSSAASGRSSSSASQSCRRKREHEPARPSLGGHVVPHQERAQDLAVRLLLDVLEEAVLAADHSPIADAHEHADRVVAVARVADDVGVAGARSTSTLAAPRAARATSARRAGRVARS